MKQHLVWTGLIWEGVDSAGQTVRITDQEMKQCSPGVDLKSLKTAAQYFPWPEMKLWQQVLLDPDLWIEIG